MVRLILTYVTNKLFHIYWIVCNVIKEHEEILAGEVMTMKEDNLILEKQLSFIMYVCSKETIRRYQTYLEDLNLTYTQYLVMLVLWNRDNIPVNELGKRLYLDSGTLTPMLKKLELKKLVKRTRDVVDGRNVLVRLTEAGEEMKEQVRDIPNTILDEAGIPSDVAEEMICKLNDILNKVK